MNIQISDKMMDPKNMASISQQQYQPRSIAPRENTRRVRRQYPCMCLAWKLHLVLLWCATRQDLRNIDGVKIDGARVGFARGVIEMWDLE